MKSVSKRWAGFTLIEVLVAATIVALLVAIGVVSFTSVNKRSRDAKRRGDIEQLRSALEMYRADNGYYPNTGSGSYANVSDLSDKLVTLGYMPAMPTDPTTGAVYRYKATNPSAAPVQYYGYCLSALLEQNPSQACAADISLSHNYGVKNP